MATKKLRPKALLPARYTKLDHIDKRTAISRRIARRAEAFKQQCDAEDDLPRALLCDRAAYLSVRIELMEKRLLELDPDDWEEIDKLQKIMHNANNTLQGLMISLGVVQKAKRAGKSLRAKLGGLYDE